MNKSAEEYVGVTKGGKVKPIDAEIAKKMNFPDAGGPADVTRKFDWKPWAYTGGGALASYLIAKALMDDDDEKDKSFISKMLPWLIGSAGALGGYALSKYAQADDDVGLIMRNNRNGTFTPAEYSDGSGWNEFGYSTGGAGALLGVRGLARHLRQKHQMAQNVLDALDWEERYAAMDPRVQALNKRWLERARSKAGPDYKVYRSRIGAVDALTGKPTADATKLLGKLQASALKLKPLTTRGKLWNTLGAEIPEGVVSRAILKKMPRVGAAAGAIKKVPVVGSLSKLPGGTRKLLNLKGKGGLAALAAGLAATVAGTYVGSKRRDEYDTAHSILDKYYTPNGNGTYSER